MQKDNQYFLVTPPMEFIRDIRDIMSDGDNLAPERLVADVVDLLKKYTSQHNQSLEWQFLELGWNVEKLPASIEETSIIIALGELRDRVKAVEHGVQPTLLTEPVNYCNPVNGVHAPFCTGHKSQIG